MTRSDTDTSPTTIKSNYSFLRIGGPPIDPFTKKPKEETASVKPESPDLDLPKPPTPHVSTPLRIPRRSEIEPPPAPASTNSDSVKHSQSKTSLSKDVLTRKDSNPRPSSQKPSKKTRSIDDADDESAPESKSESEEKKPKPKPKPKFNPLSAYFSSLFILPSTRILS